MKPIVMFAVAASLAVLYGCTKDQSAPASGNSRLQIHLTDNPFNASAVNVEILQVRVNFRGDDTGWINLDTKSGIYNLLALQNGVDTLLAQGTVPADTLREIRFVLGSRNSIKIAADSFPLTVPSGSSSGLKIKVDKKLNTNLDSLLIDFDAALSIKQTGNGKYMLMPVLKVK